MAELQPKEVKIIRPTSEMAKNSVLRVAAYCRVSTDSDDQVNSFIAQVKYYNDFIRLSDGMELVDIYADEGITGTSVSKREEFKRMIKDSRLGKIDRIYVKSVTRFARNSLECIENIRILKENGTSVYFENDGIDTDSMNSEMLLFIKSAFAQSEALSGSKRVSTACRMRMERGTFVTTCAPFGYRLIEKQLIVVPEEAEIVRDIFSEYISGKTMKQIADVLTEKRIIYYKDKSTWTKNAVCRILENEHYAGDYEYPAIISKEIYMKANSLKTQKGCKKSADSPEIVYLKKNTICSQCGKRLTRRRNYSGSRERWECLGRCKIDCFLDDRTYHEKIKEVLNSVIAQPELLQYEYEAVERYERSLDIIRQEREIDRMIEQKEPKFLPIKGAVFKAASARFDHCRLDYSKAITKKLIEFFCKQPVMEEFDFTILKKTARAITVNRDGTIKITFSRVVK